MPKSDFFACTTRTWMMVGCGRAGAYKLFHFVYPHLYPSLILDGP